MPISSIFRICVLACLTGLAPIVSADDEGLAEDGTTARAASIPPGVAIHRDLSYGNATAQRFDVYAPSHTKDAPVILMVHGGAWRFGDKGAHGVVANKVARWVTKGFVVVSTNYRMLPEADLRTQADDVAAALTKAQALAREWGGAPEKFILMGHSAGAHLVALLGANPELAVAAGAKPWLGTVILDSAALDVPSIMTRRHLPLYDQAFGRKADFWTAMSPLQQLTKAGAPLLAVCSGQRRDRPCEAARRFAEQAHSIGRRAEVLEQDLSHGEINAHLGLPSAYTEAVETFLASLDPGVAKRLATH